MEKLIYLSHTTPDIAYVVSVVSQFMHSHKEKHMEIVYKNTNKGIFYKRGTRKDLEAHKDTNWVGSVVYHKSTSGYCTLLEETLLLLKGVRSNCWLHQANLEMGRTNETL